MTSEEVGVDMRLDHALDVQPVLYGFGHVRLDVTAGIDHYSASGALVPDEIGALRQAVQVVLRENHMLRLPRVFQTLFLHRCTAFGGPGVVAAISTRRSAS